MSQLYFFVGPREILDRIRKEFEGTRIQQIRDIQNWIKNTNQILINQEVIATFVINENKELVISDRHSEHVICVGGRDVLSAGEITFEVEKNTIEMV